MPDLIKRVMLCIDDKEDVTACLESCLHDRGHTVLTGSNGTQGLELFAVHPVDVVIVDGHMSIRAYGCTMTPSKGVTATRRPRTTLTRRSG